MNRYKILLHPPKEPYETIEERLIRLRDAFPLKRCSICGKVECNHVRPETLQEMKKRMAGYSMPMDPVVADAIDTITSIDYTTALERRIIENLGLSSSSVFTPGAV